MQEYLILTTLIDSEWAAVPYSATRMYLLGSTISILYSNPDSKVFRSVNL